MMRFSKFKFIGCFLAMFLMTTGSGLSLTSCVKDADEPVFEKENTEKPGDEAGKDDDSTPGDDKDDDKDKDDTPGDDNNPDDGNKDDENTGGDTTTPVTYPKEFEGQEMGYVVLPESMAQQNKAYTSFVLSYNKDNHTPNYVSWELTAGKTSGGVSRDEYNYWVDYTLTGCLDTDYAYNTYQYERGHMCPAADNRWSAAAMKDCMVMANMCPQLSALNSGAWGSLEDKARDWAKRDQSIWIVAGPIYDETTDKQYIGKAQARVPSSFFKAFLYNGAKPRAIAFVFTNGANPGGLQSYAMSIDDLEKLTGYDFFSFLDDEVEKEVEATYNFINWNR